MAKLWVEVIASAQPLFADDAGIKLSELIRIPFVVSQR
jgi:hypothetical protein